MLRDKDKADKLVNKLISEWTLDDVENYIEEIYMTGLFDPYDEWGKISLTSRIACDIIVKNTEKTIKAGETNGIYYGRYSWFAWTNLWYVC